MSKEKTSNRISFTRGGKEASRLVTHLELERPLIDPDNSPHFLL